MLITCPECSSKFVVKAEAIGAKGRNVKCAKCGVKWFQEPDKEALEAAKDVQPEPKEAEPVKEGSNVPSVQGEKSPIWHKIAFAASFVFLLITLSIVNANSILPSMSGYYSLFGIYDSSGLALYDVKVEKTESGRYQDATVSGNIVNETEETKRIPDLKFSVISSSGKSLKEFELLSDGEEIEPGGVLEFKDRVTRLPKTSDKLIVDIGNWVELSVR